MSSRRSTHWTLHLLYKKYLEHFLGTQGTPPTEIESGACLQKDDTHWNTIAAVYSTYLKKKS